MTQGVLETKGTKLYFAVSSSEIHRVACTTGITGLGGAADQIDVTCLDSMEREFRRGMPNPSTVTVPINFIPKSASHQALIDLQRSGETISWMVSLSDQTGAPTALDSNGHLVSPGPTTIEFLGYLADMTIDIALNEIDRATLTIQRSGPLTWDTPTAVYA